MELRPGTYFRLDGQPYEYVGVKSDQASDSPDVVARLDSPRSDEALHRVFPQEDIVVRGSNFAMINERLSDQSLKEQYNQQKQILLRSRLVESDLGKLIIRSQFGEFEYPSWKHIEQQVFEKRRELREKVNQGFTRLLIVPFGLRLRDLVNRYQTTLLQLYTEGNLYKYPGKKERAEINKENPVQIDDAFRDRDTLGLFYYYPTHFGINTVSFDTRGAKLKDEVVEDTADTAFPGFHVLLIQDYPTVPPPYRLREKGGREPFPIVTEGGMEKVGEILRGSEMYAHEIGWTPEDWLMYAITNLLTRQCLTDVEGPKTPITDLYGAFVPKQSSGWNARCKGMDLVTYNSRLYTFPMSDDPKYVRTAVAIA